MDRLKDGQIEIWIDKKMDRQKDEQIGRWMDKIWVDRKMTRDIKKKIIDKNITTQKIDKKMINGQKDGWIYIYRQRDRWMDR